MATDIIARGMIQSLARNLNVSEGGSTSEDSLAEINNLLSTLNNDVNEALAITSLFSVVDGTLCITYESEEEE
ncbi:MAG: hypothetical protein LUG91_00060 [Ruminococcus sp.]|nr:hypothetical protein [Ruminococcus sp.]